MLVDLGLQWHPILMCLEVLPFVDANRAFLMPIVTAGAVLANVCQLAHDSSSAPGKANLRRLGSFALQIESCEVHKKYHLWRPHRQYHALPQRPQSSCSNFDFDD